MVNGVTGSGKSTILSALLAGQDKKFFAAKSLGGVTQEISTIYCEHLNADLNDVPGLADPRIPISKWLGIYDSQFV